MHITNLATIADNIYKLIVCTLLVYVVQCFVFLCMSYDRDIGVLRFAILCLMYGIIVDCIIFAVVPS